MRFLLIGFAAGLLPVVSAGDASQRVPLPEPALDGTQAVERSLAERRSVRGFANANLSLADVSQILWAGQGITHRRGYRTAPSAGGLYPLELYVVAGAVDGLVPGVYRYRPERHELIRVASGDRRRRLAAAALDQRWVRRAPAVLAITAVYERTEAKYGSRGRRYVHVEVGHAAQNVYLQAGARGLGTVIVGAFRDAEVASVLELPADHRPLALMPLGRRR